LKALKESLWFGALCVTVVAHYIVFFANGAAVVILPFCQPWYVSIPLVTFLFNLGTNNWNCPLTVLENWIRVKKLGMPKIKSFMATYILFR
jgi:hypothetical protein